MTPWGSTPITNFAGVAGEKIMMGITASATAGGAAYVNTPKVLNDLKDWLKANNYPMAGFMMWDSHWDDLNNRLLSNACIQ